MCIWMSPYCSTATLVGPAFAFWSYLEFWFEFWLSPKGQTTAYRCAWGYKAVDPFKMAPKSMSNTCTSGILTSLLSIMLKCFRCKVWSELRVAERSCHQVWWIVAAKSLFLSSWCSTLSHCNCQHWLSSSSIFCQLLLSSIGIVECDYCTVAVEVGIVVSPCRPFMPISPHLDTYLIHENHDDIPWNSVPLRGFRGTLHNFSRGSMAVT